MVWLTLLPQIMQPFVSRWDELTVEDHCQLWDIVLWYPQRYELMSCKSYTVLSATTDHNNGVLRSMLAAYGLPEQVVSDNRPQWTAEEFAYFLYTNGITHVWAVLYHPSSNGALKSLETFKHTMKVGEGEGVSLQHQLQSVLMTYRNTLMQQQDYH